MTSLYDIESKLRQIIEAVQAGREDGLDALLDELDGLVTSLDSAGDSPAADTQALARVHALWKQAALALADAGQDAQGQLMRTVAGKTTLKVYKA